MCKKVVTLLVTLAALSGCSSRSSQDLQAEAVKLLREGNTNSAKVLLKNALEKDAGNSGARFYLGRVYLLEGKYELAEKEFQKAGEEKPSRPEIQLELAKVCNLSQRPDEAIRYAEEYLEMTPDSAEAYEIIGMAYAGKQRPLEAEEFFRKALSQEPERVSTKVEQATLYMVGGKSGQAKKIIEEALKQAPGNKRALLMLADIENSLGQKEQALTYYKKVSQVDPNEHLGLYKSGIIYLDRGDTKPAEQTAAELIGKFPGRGEGYRLKGMLLYRDRDFQGAINELQKAHKLAPTASGYYLIGLCLYNLGQLENALSHFKQLVDRSPSFHQARLMSGMILLRQNRLDDAISEMLGLIKTGGNKSLAYSLLGSAYLAKGMQKEGVEALDTAIKIAPGLADPYVKKGMYNLSRGNLAEVEGNFTEAIRVAPDVLNSRLILSSYYMQRNNRAKAFETLKNGLRGKAGDVPLYFGMAKIMFAEKKVEEAVNLLEKAKQSDPHSFDPYFAIASYYAINGDSDKALQQYSAVLAKDTSNAKAQIRIGSLLEAAGRESEALEWYQRAKGNRNQEAYQHLAHYYEKRGETKKALELLAEAVGQMPRSVDLQEQRGLLYLKNNQYKEALRAGDDLEALEPERAVRLKVSAYQAMKKYPEAILQAQRAIQLKPNSSYGYQLLASVYQAQNKPDLAIESLQKGIGLDRNNHNTSLMLAGLYSRNGKMLEAMKMCDEIIRKEPGHAPAYFTQGTFLEAQGDKRGAVKKYQAALAVTGNYAPALNNLAALYADGLGSPDEAVRLAEEALAMEPVNPGIMDTLGYALLKKGRTTEARTYLEKAEALAPGNPSINYHLALLYKTTGEKNQAVVKLLTALRAGEFQELRQARILLSELK